MKVTITSILLTLVLLAGCEDEGSAGKNGYSSLLDIQIEQPGAHCMYGGYVVYSGLDTNENNFLDPLERISTEYLCQPSPDITCPCDDGKDGENGHATLFLIYDEDPGENCRYGGKSLRWGLDTDDDGVLMVDEIDGTEYICNGEPGPATLLETIQEDPGANCSGGGLKLITGVDENQNGAIDVNEVDSVQYLCNGSDGYDSLIRMEPDDGTHCPSGGTVIYAGPDVNENGILDDTEITDEAWVCD
ncbi:hypothetical protein KKF34_06270 [Myxococcota bacterium]|nr:hypothetical protein [Myxococcota bacterium]MBU1381776.1 hypothetical protein [Myxococcota bacterium]MBU1496464.1 hypothetical protein [Myxococcota bacterium]